MKKLISFLLLISILIPTAVIASDISSAEWYGVITVSNNSSTDNTNVSTVFTANTTALIATGYMNDSANNTAIRTSSGADVAYMPGYGPDGNPWALWIPSIDGDTYQSDILYMGGTANMDGKIRYFPGSSGMTIAADASMEPSDNFSTEVSAFFDTSYDTVNKTYVDKSRVYRIFNGAADNITAQIASPASGYYYDTASDGYLEGTHAVYVNCRDLAAATGIDAAGLNLNVGQRIPANFDIFRSAIYFNTANVNPTDVILSATLYLWGKVDNSAADFDVVIQDGQPAHPADPLVIGDFDRTFYAGDGGSFNTAAFAVGAYNAITLNAAGIAMITRGGATKLLLRSGEDIGNSPPAGQEWVTFASANTAGTDNDPYLEITVASYPGVEISVGSLTSGEYDIEVAMESPFLGMVIDDVLEFPVTSNLTLNSPLWQVESSSTPFTTIDSQAYSFTPTGATWTSAGYYFDGNDYLKNSDANWRSGDSQGTIIVWYQRPGVGTMTLVGSGDEATANYFMTFQINAGGSLVFTQRSNDIADTVQGDTNLNDTLWHQVILSSDGSAYSMYVDLIPQVLSVTSGGNNGDWFDNTPNRDNLVFGALIRSAIIQYVTGTIGEVQYYDRALTSDERQQNYDAVEYRYLGTGTNNHLHSTVASVPENSNDWIVSYNASTPYLLNFMHTVNGTLQSHIEWEYDTTFTDLSGNGNDATPSFRGASSDPFVSATLASFLPISEADAPAYSLATAPDFITTTPGSTGNFTSTVNATYPGHDIITEIAISAAVPEQLVTNIMVAFLLVVISLSMTYALRSQGSGSILWKSVVIMFAMGIFVAVRVMDVWQIYFFVIMAIGLMWWSRQREAY